MNPSSPSLASAFRWAVCVGVLALDQATKYWARVRFSLPGGQPDYFHSIPVVGDWLQLRLVYNTGAAFGMRPQNVLPFLQPTVFYVIFSIAAIIFLTVYYRRLSPGEQAARIGVVLILAGAFGNLLDRLRFHRVTDFIDVGVPGIFPRWPTFNVADSSVCIGMGILLLLPLITRRLQGVSPGAAAGSVDAS